MIHEAQLMSYYTHDNVIQVRLRYRIPTFYSNPSTTIVTSVMPSLIYCNPSIIYRNPVITVLLVLHLQ